MTTPERSPAAPRTPVVGAPLTPEPAIPRRAQALIALLTVATATFAAMLWSGGDSSATTAATSASSSARFEGSRSIVPTGHTTEVTVMVDGMSFTPSTIEVPAGDALVITFHNTGDQRHDLVLANGARTQAISPGESATLDAGVITASLDGWCSIAGHRAMGMQLTVVAVGADGATAAADAARPSDSTAEMSDVSGEDVARPTMADLMAAAQATDAAPAELEPLTDSTVHDYTFTVTESTEAIADGVTRAVWSYNGTLPGPTLHGRVGDTFRITLVNDGTMSHSIDFHAGDISPDEAMRSIEPGQTLVYEFTANRSGIWMYHCGTMPMTQHIANGLFGAVVIEPDGLEPVDHQYVLIQSELYLGTDGGTASEAKASAVEPDVVAFNGRAFQYVAHPLTAAVGERVRFWVLDAGPSTDLAFHVVGAQFDTVWSEGMYSVYHGASTDGLTQGVTGAQVLPLLAAQGGFVEMVPTEPGHYAFVNHIMASAEKGAKGILEVTE